MGCTSLLWFSASGVTRLWTTGGGREAEAQQAPAGVRGAGSVCPSLPSGVAACSLTLGGGGGSALSLCGGHWPPWAAGLGSTGSPGGERSPVPGAASLAVLSVVTPRLLPRLLPMAPPPRPAASRSPHCLPMAPPPAAPSQSPPPRRWDHSNASTFAFSFISRQGVGAQTAHRAQGTPATLRLSRDLY